MPSHRKDRPRTGAAGTPPAPRREFGAFLDRWPFRRKLDVLVFVPVLVIAAMLCFVAYLQVGQARSAAATAQLVRDSEQVAKLIDGLQTEHRQALLVSLHYEALGPGASSAPDTAAYHTSQVTVDKQVAAVREVFGDRLPELEAQALHEVEALDMLRSSIETGPFAADNIDPAYDDAVADLINGLGMNGTEAGGAPTGTAGTLLDALLRADAAHASFETAVFAARTGDANALIEFRTAVGANEQYTYQVERFRRYATEEQGDEVSGIDPGGQSIISQHYAALVIDPSGLVADTPVQVRSALKKSLVDVPVYDQQALQRLSITRSLIGQIASDTQEASNEAWFRAAALLLAAVLGFAAWLLFSVLARRSVLGTVRALTSAAQEVADATGQELARVADDDAADAGPPRLTAVPVPVRDEIGELAEAFNQVQVTATALLERQVLSRRNIAEMFGNVGRRVSNLTARQLALIDSVERGETDPETLERLYRIDHIAVRLQRNADSLMLLAGIRETGLAGGPARLSNVVRAALGQIEAYQRVTPRAEGDVTVSPDVVGDLTLMLAELLENAVTFSPASTHVELMLRSGTGPQASSGPRAGGAVVEIVDHGLGMSTERLEEENARLVRRERLDLVPTKVLGLFVVGVLSRRWGIEVTLSRTPGGGVTAKVVIPSVHLLPLHAASTPTPRPVASPDRSTGSPQPSLIKPPEAGGSGLPRRVPARRLQGEPEDDAAGEARPAEPGRARRPGPAWARLDEADPFGPDGADPAGSTRPDGSRGTHGADGSGTPDASGTPARSEARDASARSEAAGRANGSKASGGRTPGSAGSGRTPVPGATSPRPLRRRVRGATLAATTAARMQAPQPEAPLEGTGTWRYRDADAARDELDEFEAAVARAHRDSAQQLFAPVDGSADGTDGAATSPKAAPPSDDPVPPLPHAARTPLAHRAPRPPAPAVHDTTRTSPTSSSEGAGQ